MGNRFYGVNNLPTKWRQEDVLTGTGTQSTDVEIRIDDTKNWNRQSLKVALEKVIDRITSGTNDLGKI